MVSKRAWMAILALAGLLAAGLLATAQPGHAASGQSTLPPSGAGAAAAPPSADKSYREQMLLVGSPLMLETAAARVLEVMASTYRLAPPDIKLTGTTAGITEFCAGVGVDTPDIVAASRTMRKGEYLNCRANGVYDIIEVKIGLMPIMVVTRRGDQVFSVSPRMFYLALAKDLPIGTHFDENPNKTWRDVDPTAPDIPISVILPAEGSGVRSFFNDYVLQAGCRHYPGINTIYAASLRVPRCITLRGGEQIRELPEPYDEKLMAAFADMPPNSLAVVSALVYLRYADQLEYVPVDGVEPNRQEVASYHYPLVALPRFYVKRAHMRNSSGEGVVRGLREFMRLASSEAFTDPGGVFDDAGLHPLEEDEREAVREAVHRLKGIKR